MLFFAGRMATYNPWQVESIQAFYYLKCPECEFNTIDENMFEDHAIENHPMSLELFGKKSLKEREFDYVMIKEEQISDVDEQDNNCEKYDFIHTDMIDKNNLSNIKKVKKEPLDEQFESKDRQNIAFDQDRIDQVKNKVIDKDFESEDHIASVHEEKKPWYCFQCKQGFISNSILKLHFESEHEGKNLYKCPKCNSDFSQKVNLKRHMETVHEVKKILKCTTCSYECHQKSDMEKHMKTHYLDKLKDENQEEFSLSEEKPKLTYAQLIAEALSNASEGMLLLSDIYTAISSRHPYYKLENTNWQNCIRHQLSINDSFVKAEKTGTGTGRGCYWKFSDNLQGGVAKYLKKINPRQFDPELSEPVTKMMKLGEEFKDENQKEFSLSEEKPKLTYAQLIEEALINASEGMLLLSDIYLSISSMNPYYKLENTNWQNRIRHQLSINDSFVKAEKTVAGRRSYWKLSSVQNAKNLL